MSMKLLLSIKTKVTGLSSIGKSSFLTALFISLCACSSAQQRVVIDESFEPLKKSNPVQEDVLACFSDMLATYWRRDGQPRVIRAAVIDFKDATSVSTEQYPNSEIPPEFSDFGVTALSKIGYPIQVVHVPKESELISAVRYSGLKKGQYLGSYTPKPYDVSTIQLYGALTEYDRFVSGKNQRLDSAIDFGGGDTEGSSNFKFNRINNQARMTMDVHIVRGAIGDVITRANAFNTVYLSQSGKDFELGLGVQGDSIGYARSVSTVDARHLAMRLLVESNLIEAIGKYAHVPYFRCYEQTEPTQQVMAKPAKQYAFSCPYKQKEGATTCELGPLKKSQSQTNVDHAVFHFNKAEYYLNGKRYYVARPKTSQPLSSLITVSDPKVQQQLQSVTIRGRQDMLNDLLGIYTDAGQTDGANKQLSDDDLFTYLWLNAPVLRGRRWR